MPRWPLACWPAKPPPTSCPSPTAAPASAPSSTPPRFQRQLAVPASLTARIWTRRSPPGSAGPSRTAWSCCRPPRRASASSRTTATAARPSPAPSARSADASVLPGEALPGGLLGHAERLADPGPADAPAAQDVHVVVHGRVGLGHHRLDLGQGGQQLVVGPLVPRAERARGLVGDDQVAQVDALVADVDAGAGHQLGDGVLVLVAERAGQRGQPGLARHRELGGRSHVVKVSLTPPKGQGYLDGMAGFAARLHVTTDVAVPRKSSLSRRIASTPGGRHVT